MRCEYAGPAAAAPERSFLDDVLLGLGLERKALPCKYFYDERGSALFDQICELPEYYPTRTELAIMREHARGIASTLGPQTLLVEFGSGSSSKTRLLLAALDQPAGYVPVDISGEHLERSAEAIRRERPGLAVAPVHGDFTRSFELPAALCKAARRLVVYFPGSTIGNFATRDAESLLRSISALVGDAGGLLIGTDLVKATHVLEAAYDDARGVTAEFNLNLLARINRELHGDFRLDCFQHRSRYDVQEARVEISIQSLVDQVVSVGGRTFSLARGEQVLTEYSHKYTLSGFGKLARRAELGIERVWTDPENLFAVQFLTRTPPKPLS